VPQYVVDLARLSRQHPDLALGASPRASLSLLQASRARALLLGRRYCTHEDVQAMAPAAWGHRLILKPEAEIEGRTVAGALAQILAQAPVLRR
jgi:MoxR-like ATPase